MSPLIRWPARAMCVRLEIDEYAKKNQFPLHKWNCVTKVGLFPRIERLVRDGVHCTNRSIFKHTAKMTIYSTAPKKIAQWLSSFSFSSHVPPLSAVIFRLCSHARTLSGLNSFLLTERPLLNRLRLTMAEKKAQSSDESKSEKKYLFWMKIYDIIMFFFRFFSRASTLRLKRFSHVHSLFGARVRECFIYFLGSFNDSSMMCIWFSVQSHQTLLLWSD